MDCRGPGFLGVVWFGSFHPPPRSSVSSTDEKERQLADWRMGMNLIIRREKAVSSIIHWLLSDVRMHAGVRHNIKTQEQVEWQPIFNMNNSILCFQHFRYADCRIKENIFGLENRKRDHLSKISNICCHTHRLTVLITQTKTSLMRSMWPSQRGNKC